MKKIKNLNLLSLSIIIIFTVFISSCSDDVVNSNNNLDPYELKVWDYADNHFLLDTLYKQSYESYYANGGLVSFHMDSISVVELDFEVWVQGEITNSHTKAALYADLPAIPPGGYDDSLKTVLNFQQGINAFGNVRKLTSDEYILQKFAGYVSLLISLPDNYFAGVAYKRKLTDEQFGTISTDTSAHPNDTLVLKMIKVQSLIPQNLLAWEMKLKNIYKLPATNISESGFEFDVKYLSGGIYSSNLPGITENLITILGLDKPTGIPGTSDGKFDFNPGITIDTENGWIIFPSIKPFLDKMESYNNNGQTIDSVYWYSELYSELKANAKTLPNANNYIFTGYLK
ncbi:MAG: hypothetical protein IPL53_03725 [Ignavibacteria bacterium]|nr:hypothetical protein [Ignavibacteria bacterium]